MADWYERNIEPGVRSLVRLLRDNGFNTFSSCEHTGEIVMDWGLEADVGELAKLLMDNGYVDFSIKCDVAFREAIPLLPRMILRIPKEYLDSGEQ